MKARPTLLGACKFCPSLRSEVAEKNAKIASLEKAISKSTTSAKCALCEGLEIELEGCRHEKRRTEEENTHLRSVLSWVSCSEPQLGMLVSQFKRGTGGPGVGFASGGDGKNLFGKIGEGSGLDPSEKPTPTLKLTKMPPP